VIAARSRFPVGPDNHEATTMTEPTTDSAPALDLTLKDPRLEAALAAASDRAVKESWADRAIGRRDPSIWSGDDVVQRAIATRLAGWRRRSTSPTRPAS